jgi:hypothetical protein
VIVDSDGVAGERRRDNAGVWGEQFRQFLANDHMTREKNPEKSVLNYLYIHEERGSMIGNTVL